MAEVAISIEQGQEPSATDVSNGDGERAPTTSYGEVGAGGVSSHDAANQDTQHTVSNNAEPLPKTIIEEQGTGESS